MANLLSQNEIDVLMNAISTGQLQTAENVGGATKTTSQRNVMLYDFRHPVMFIKDQMRTLQMIHETFARSFASSMASQLRTTVKAKCIGVDQISYSEFVLSLPDPCTVVTMRFRPAEGRVLMAIHPAVGMSVVDRMMGGAGNGDSVARPFTEIEMAIMDEFVATALRDLHPAWNRITEVKFIPEGTEFSAQFVQIAAAEDTVVAITLEVKFGDTQGIISFCYPFRSLNPIGEKLSAKHWTVEDQKNAAAARSRMSIRNCVDGVPVQAAARLGTTTITMRDLTQIKPGDVLLLDQDINQLIELVVGGRTRYYGHLGSYHGKTAMLVDHRAVLD
jgi:flagellar motor switch protein FliM